MNIWQILSDAGNPDSLKQTIDARNQEMLESLQDPDPHDLTLGSHFRAVGDHIRNAMNAFAQELEHGTDTVQS